MQEVQVIAKDDFNHSELADETVPFGFRGIPYEIDLTAANVAKFEADMAPYLKVARKAKRKQRRKLTVTLPAANGQAEVVVKKKSHRSQAQQEAGAQRDRIRDWAEKTDWTDEDGKRQSRVGRLKAELVEAYFKEHTEEVPVV